MAQVELDNYPKHNEDWPAGVPLTSTISKEISLADQASLDFATATAIAQKLQDDAYKANVLIHIGMGMATTGVYPTTIIENLESLVQRAQEKTLPGYDTHNWAMNTDAAYGIAKIQKEIGHLDEAEAIVSAHSSYPVTYQPRFDLELIRKRAARGEDIAEPLKRAIDHVQVGVLSDGSGYAYDTRYITFNRIEGSLLVAQTLFQIGREQEAHDLFSRAKGMIKAIRPDDSFLKSSYANTLASVGLVTEALASLGGIKIDQDTRQLSIERKLALEEVAKACLENGQRMEAIKIAFKIGYPLLTAEFAADAAIQAVDQGEDSLYFYAVALNSLKHPQDARELKARETTADGIPVLKAGIHAKLARVEVKTIGLPGEYFAEANELAAAIEDPYKRSTAFTLVAEQVALAGYDAHPYFQSALDAADSFYIPGNPETSMDDAMNEVEYTMLLDDIVATQIRAGYFDEAREIIDKREAVDPLNNESQQTKAKQLTDLAVAESKL